MFPTDRSFCERRLLVPLHCDFLLCTFNYDKFSFFGDVRQGFDTTYCV
jgi:hypothetical protein